MEVLFVDFYKKIVAKYNKFEGQEISATTIKNILGDRSIQSEM
jgi:hypothetical protein